MLGLESWIMLEIGAYKAMLFLWSRVETRVTKVGSRGVVVVVAPFRLSYTISCDLDRRAIKRPSCIVSDHVAPQGLETHKMICKFQARKIGICILKVNDHEPLMLVSREEKR